MQILVRHGDEFTLFVAIDCQMGGLDVAGGARLDLDEAEDVSLPANEVDFSATPKRAEISRDHDVSELAQVEVGRFFAPPPGLLMFRFIFGAAREGYKPIECLQGDFGEAAGHGAVHSGWHVVPICALGPE